MKKIALGVVLGFMLSIPATSFAASHPYYTSEEIEEMHDNTESMLLYVKEEDGDYWLYAATDQTGDYWKALN